MALIKCDECGRAVSSQAGSCPGCGAPMARSTPSPSLWESVSQRSGPKEVVIRGTDVGYEAQKIGEKLTLALLALFLHPVFSFVGFWILCVVGIVHLAPVLGVSTRWNDSPDWYPIAAAVVALVPTVLLRRFVPRIMKWLLFVGGTALVIWGVMDIAGSVGNR